VFGRVRKGGVALASLLFLSGGVPKITHGRIIGRTVAAHNRAGSGPKVEIGIEYRGAGYSIQGIPRSLDNVVEEVLIGCHSSPAIVVLRAAGGVNRIVYVKRKAGARLQLDAYPLSPLQFSRNTFRKILHGAR